MGGTSDDAGSDADAAQDGNDAAPDAPVCMGQCGDPGCGTCPTIPMIAAQMPDGKAYLIDALETTVAEYQVFLDANVAKQDDEACEWNETYEPDPVVYTYPQPDMPIHAVDWCDARAYCEWADKRLCKDSYDWLEDATKSEWYNACTLGGTQEYPYGDTYDPAACPPVQEPYTPGTVDSCQGAYPGLYDMANNVGEWTDGCNTGQPGYLTSCVSRGTPFGASTGEWACLGGNIPRQSYYHVVGIRCCKD